MGIRRKNNRKKATGFRIQGKYFLGGLLFIFIISIIVWVVGLRIDTGINEKSSIDYSVTPTPDYPLDTENDGVYTNYKYGYRFLYPVDIFDAEPKSTGEEIGNPYMSEGWYRTRSEFGIGRNSLSLDTYVYPENKEGDLPWKLYESFDDVKDLPPGSAFLNGNGVKLRNVSRNGVLGVVLYFKTPPEINWQLEYQYRAQFLKGGYKYSVGLVSDDYQLLKNHEAVFGDILDSFEFTE